MSTTEKSNNSDNNHPVNSSSLFRRRLSLTAKTTTTTATSAESTATTTAALTRPPLHHHETAVAAARDADVAVTATAAAAAADSPWRSRFFQRGMSPTLPESTKPPPVAAAAALRKNNGSSSSCAHGSLTAAATTSTFATGSSLGSTTGVANSSSPNLSFPLEYSLPEVENIDQAMFSLYSMTSMSAVSSSASASSSYAAAFSAASSSSYIVQPEFDPILDAQLGDDVWNYTAPFENDDENENDEAVGATQENSNSTVQERRSQQLLCALHQDALQSGWETLFLQAAATFAEWLQQQQNDDDVSHDDDDMDGLVQERSKVVAAGDWNQPNNNESSSSSSSSSGNARDQGNDNNNSKNHPDEENHCDDDNTNIKNDNDWFQFGDFQSQNNPTTTTETAATPATSCTDTATATITSAASIIIADVTTTTAITTTSAAIIDTATCDPITYAAAMRNDTGDEDDDDDDFGEFQTASSSSSLSLPQELSLPPPPPLPPLDNLAPVDDVASARQSPPCPPRQEQQQQLEESTKASPRPKPPPPPQPLLLLQQPTIVQLPPLPSAAGPLTLSSRQETEGANQLKQEQEQQEALEYWRQTLPTSIFNQYSLTTLAGKQQQQQDFCKASKPKQQVPEEEEEEEKQQSPASNDSSRSILPVTPPRTVSNGGTDAVPDFSPAAVTTAATTLMSKSCTTATIWVDAAAADAPISLTLPITDLTTLEARFTRRRQLEYERQQQQQHQPDEPVYDDDENHTMARPVSQDDQDLEERLDQLLPNFSNSGSISKSTDFMEMSQFLGSLPWGYLEEHLDDDGGSGEGGSSNSSHEENTARTEQSAGLILWDEHMTDQLCQMDGLLQLVQQSLLQRACRPSTTTSTCCSSKLQQANDLIHEFETNLRLAFMYWERSNTSLQLAARTASSSGGDDTSDDDTLIGGLLGPQVLLNLWQQREEYQSLQHILNQLHSVLEQEGEIIRRIDAFDARHASALEEYRSVMELAQRITPLSNNDSDMTSIDGGILSKLTCLDELRARRSSLGDRFRKRLQQVAKSLVVQACRGRAVDWMQYERLVRSTLDLHSLHHLEQDYQPDDDDVGLNQYHCDDDKKDDDDVMLVHDFDNSCVRMATTWSETIMQALSYEADCCLATALLEPTDRVASDFERELGQLSQEIQLDWGDAAKLRTMTHNLVTIRFDFEASKINYFPRVFHCLCQGLTKVLHAHFLFLQWHRAPFDCEKCRTIAQLHQVRNEEHQKQQHLATDVDCSAKNQDVSRLRYMLDGLEASRLNLWNRCENVIVLCLDEYLNFASKRKLFQRAGGEAGNISSGVGEDGIAAGKIDDSLWARQLQGYHEVLAMADHFYAIKASFLEEKTFVGGQRNSFSPVHQRLKAIYRQHLRIVHVEAMNTLGRQLSTETWVLRSLDTSRPYEPTEGTFTDVEQLLRDAIRATTENKQVLFSKKSKWCPANGNAKHAALNCFYDFLENGNPFQAGHKDFAALSTSQKPMSMYIVATQQHAIPDVHTAVYSEIRSVLQEDEDNSMPRCATESIASGLVPWVSRLLIILDKLPVIADEVICVFANLFDLYFATVFRLCAGSSHNERILLMAEEPPSSNVATTTGKDPRKGPSTANSKRPSSPTMFGSFGKERRPSGQPATQRTPVTIPSSLEVEMCGPRLKDSAKLVPLRRFIERAQASLQGIVNLDRANSWIPESSNAVDADEYACDAARLLEKREAAAWSCYLVAALADVALSLVKTSTPTLFSDSLEPLESYVLAVMQAVPPLVKTICQYSCIKAIAGLDVAKRIVTVGSGWEEQKLHEHPNDYVEDLADRCALIWGFLSASGKLPFEIRRQAWGSLLCGCYLSLLEGFARVPYCSTEGRALMTLDLASFSAMMDKTSVAERLESRGLSFTPPFAAPEYGMRYVGTWINVFYYPKEDVMQWIGQNYESYRLIHVLALLNDSSAGKKDQGLPALVEKVNALYHQRELVTPIGSVEGRQV